MNRDDPNYSEETVLNAEYKEFFESQERENDPEGVGNPLYKLQVFNNTAPVPGLIFTYRKRCELCDKEHKDNCDFGGDDERQKIG